MRCWAVVTLGAALAVPVSTPCTFGQAASQTGRPAVELRIHPHVGDTIRARLEQHLEMTATRPGTPDHPDSTTHHSRMSTVALLRSIVRASDASSSMLVVLIDSMRTEGDGMPLPSETQRHVVQGRRFHVRVTAHGAMTLLDPPERVTVAGSSFGSVPATLPAEPVAVGETWMRTMIFPIAGAEGKGAMRVNALFHLDSLTRGGDFAYVSMRGTVLRDTAPELPPGVLRIVTGDVHGTMRVDRRRGWIADSWTSLDVRSLVTTPAAPARAPLRIDVKLTQRMWALD